MNPGRVVPDPEARLEGFDPDPQPDIARGNQARKPGSGSTTG